jgi:hypothetical protein
MAARHMVLLLALLAACTCGASAVGFKGNSGMEPNSATSIYRWESARRQPGRPWSGQILLLQPACVARLKGLSHSPAGILSNHWLTAAVSRPSSHLMPQQPVTGGRPAGDATRHHSRVLT